MSCFAFDQRPRLFQITVLGDVNRDSESWSEAGTLTNNLRLYFVNHETHLGKNEPIGENVA